MLTAVPRRVRILLKKDKIRWEFRSNHDLAHINFIHQIHFQRECKLTTAFCPRCEIFGLQNLSQNTTTEKNGFENKDATDCSTLPKFSIRASGDTDQLTHYPKPTCTCSTTASVSHVLPPHLSLVLMIPIPYISGAASFSHPDRTDTYFNLLTFYAETGRRQLGSFAEWISAVHHYRWKKNRCGTISMCDCETTLRKARHNNRSVGKLQNLPKIPLAL